MQFLKKIDGYDNRLIINLELLPYCNFKCAYCYEHRKVKFGNIINLKQLRLINKALTYSKYDIELCLLGGEPLYYPHLNQAVDLFQDNSKIKQITLYTNGSKLIDKRLLNDNIYFILSYHPSQNNKNFLTNVYLLKQFNCNFEINLLMHYKYKKRLLNIDNELKQLNVKVKPTYLYIPTSEYKTNTKMFKIQDPFLNCEQNNEYNLNGLNITKNYLLTNKLNSFYKWKCKQQRLCINNIGNICIGCGPAKDNIFRNPNFFKNYNMNEIICENDYCVKDMFLIQEKMNDIL